MFSMFWFELINGDILFIVRISSEILFQSEYWNHVVVFHAFVVSTVNFVLKRISTAVHFQWKHWNGWKVYTIDFYVKKEINNNAKLDSTTFTTKW